MVPIKPINQENLKPPFSTKTFFALILLRIPYILKDKVFVMISGVRWDCGSHGGEDKHAIRQSLHRDEVYWGREGREGGREKETERQ